MQKTLLKNPEPGLPSSKRIEAILERQCSAEEIRHLASAATRLMDKMQRHLPAFCGAKLH